MKVIAKLLLGIASLAPLAYLAAFAFWLLPSFFYAYPESGPSVFSQRFEILLPFAKLTAALLVGITVCYALLLYRRSRLPLLEKVLVPAAIIFSNGLLAPPAWWLYVWKEQNLSAVGSWFRSRRDTSSPGPTAT